MNNTFYCSSSTVCSSQPPALTDSVLNVMIANGALESEEYVEESRAIAEEYLYRELADDSVLWFSDSTYIQFMIENQGEPVAYLYDVEEYLRAAYTYDSTLLTIVDSAYQQIDMFNDSLIMIDEGIIEDDEGLLREQFINAINFLNQTIQNINIQREAIINDNLNNAENQNDYVVNGELPEINSAYMNEIEINYLENGEDLQYIIDNYSGIFTIANQCPYVGGEAVERARTYIALINDSIFYDDANVCLQSGVYRIANADSSIQNANSIVIKPNPANNKVEISLVGKFDNGVCKVEIRNFIGEIILIDEMNCKDKRKVINLSKLSQGVYTIKVHTNNFELIQKLVIVK